MFRSCCNLAASSSLAIVLYVLVSSANNFTVDFSRAGKSFMYSKNSAGENSAPCGTPDKMGSQFEKFAARTTLSSSSVTQECYEPTHEFAFNSIVS